MSRFPALLEFLSWFLLVACKPNKLIPHRLAFSQGIVHSNRKETRAPAEVINYEIFVHIGLPVTLGLLYVKLAEISSYFPFISWVIPIFVKVYNLKTHVVDLIFSMKLLFNMNVYNKEDSYAAFRIKRKAMDTHRSYIFIYILIELRSWYCRTGYEEALWGQRFTLA